MNLIKLPVVSVMALRVCRRPRLQANEKTSMPAIKKIDQRLKRYLWEKYTNSNKNKTLKVPSQRGNAN